MMIKRAFFFPIFRATPILFSITTNAPSAIAQGMGNGVIITKDTDECPMGTVYVYKFDIDMYSDADEVDVAKLSTQVVFGNNLRKEICDKSKYTKLTEKERLHVINLTKLSNSCAYYAAADVTFRNFRAATSYTMAKNRAFMSIRALLQNADHREILVSDSKEAAENAASLTVQMFGVRGKILKAFGAVGAKAFRTLLKVIEEEQIEDKAVDLTVKKIDPFGNFADNVRDNYANIQNNSNMAALKSLDCK